ERLVRYALASGPRGRVGRQRLPDHVAVLARDTLRPVVAHTRRVDSPVSVLQSLPFDPLPARPDADRQGQCGYSPCAPTTRLPGASTSPRFLRKSLSVPLAPRPGSYASCGTGRWCTGPD